MPKLLNDKSLIILFAYAPAGFGHLRVTDALYHGLPKDVTPLLLGSEDKSITYIHRLMSIHPLVFIIARWAEEGWGETVLTYFYRMFLRNHTDLLYAQVATILNERIEIPKAILIVATHFGLAHQLGALKEKLKKEKNIRVILVVCVTDDYPHSIWYVEEADMIVVPSEKTKAGLTRFGKFFRLTKPRIEVLAYPISPILGKGLGVKKVESRITQVISDSKTTIHISIPISGAAVGIQFITKVMDFLRKKSDRFLFHVIVKSTNYTHEFINDLNKRSYVVLHIATHDREVVTLYEQVYKQYVISLEITKPSEQTFKALYDSSKTGGSLLLFASPIGKQEAYNLDFLRRHKLIPSYSEKKQLFKACFNSNHSADMKHILQQATNFRGLELPKGSEKAAEFIWWCLNNGIFVSMMNCRLKPSPDDYHVKELHPNGVKEFWQEVQNLLSS